MTGGLLQIISHGTEDLFLNGNPEITFFKMIYRRHTNFAIELKRLHYNDNVGFGKTTTFNLTKDGDLIHKMYLEITIPEFYIDKILNDDEKLNIANLTLLYESYLANYEVIKNFLSYNLNAYKDIYQIYETNDIIYSKEIFDKINEYTNAFQNTPDYNDLLVLISQFKLKISVYHIDTEITDYIYTYRYNLNKGNINLNSISSYIPDAGDGSTILKETSMQIINMIINTNQKLDKDYVQLIVDTKKELDKISKPYYNFAWVNRLGHSIIDYVEFFIGGNKIDKLYGLWLDIWFELSGNKDHKQSYLEMIGEVSQLTTYDNNIKPEYKLYIPLQFWFCKYVGLSLPIIALQYSTVFIRFKFRKFSECSYTDMPYQETTTIDRITKTIVHGSLDNVIENKGIDMDATLLVEYIYLDSYERKKFARSTHEYLIEQLQINYEQNLSTTLNTLRLDFNHPCKGFIWIIQREKSLIKSSNSFKCLWTDYTLENADIPDTYINNDDEIENIDKSKFNLNPVFNSKITLNDVDRVIKLESNFFNYVQPYQHLLNSPEEGINSYWFSIYPKEHQPSGSCNSGYIPELKLYTETDPYFFNHDDTYVLTIYALNYNVLRISNGLGNIAYV